MFNKISLVKSCFAGICIIGFGVSIISSCHETKVKKQGVENGKEMAEQYCGSCHLYVDPSVLDKATWTQQVLPNMATRLGIRVWGQSSYFQPNPGDTPAIPYQDWMDLVAYYKATAPDKLPASKLPVPFEKDWSVFALKKFTVKDTSHDVTTCMITYDASADRIYTSNEENDQLDVWSNKGEHLRDFRMPTAAVNVSIYKNPAADTIERMFSCIGQMTAIDDPKGSAVRFNPEKDADPAYNIVEGFLPRPVQSVAGDFNKDGLTDYIVCGFGHEQGALLRMQQKPDHRFDIDTIKAVPGAIQAQVGDFNNDGWPDVMVLFAHAKEGVYLFLNNQKGGFTEKNLLEFPPVWGSSSFQYTDVNHDGKPDIIYTCGDNADYSVVLKPFHGMYIFLNQGNMQFKQSYFFPIHGCYKAMAGDFDGDGDIDIATIGFFIDEHTPEEGFVYFEQDGPMHFKPHALPIQDQGRWICMDVADVDKDGDLDILLGNYSKGFRQEGKGVFWNTHQPFTILENKTK